MHSSTSSSEALARDAELAPHLHVVAAPLPAVHDVRRTVPAHNWSVMAACAAIGCMLLVAAWEHHVRWLGYVADYDDTPGLWVKQRQLAATARPEQLVLVGASRTLFDLDLDVLQGAAGSRPI